ncbi:hypothetical protein VN0932_09400 [Helicobacter pylori]
MAILRNSKTLSKGNNSSSSKKFNGVSRHAILTPEITLFGYRNPNIVNNPIKTIY